MTCCTSALPNLNTEWRRGRRSSCTTATACWGAAGSGEPVMFSSTFALLSRSLRQDSRLLLPHLMRGGLLGFALWLLFVANEESRFLGAPGLLFFRNIAWLN